MSKKPEHVFLIDGSGFIFRAYYALPPMTRPDGTPVNAVFGFTKMVMKLVDDTDAEHIAVIFDRARKTFRNDIYADYKANRPPPPEDLIPQFDLVRDATRALNVACVDMDGFEADDLIATYARLAIEAGADVTIVSSDKDMMQLVRPGVVMMDAMKDKILQARKFFRENLPEEKQAGIAFFAEDTYNPKLNTQRNMLMGTINHTIPHAEERLNDIIFKVLEEMDLTEDMIHLATRAPVGVGGSKLSQADRQKVVLARSLIKKPDIVIFNEALSALDRKTQDRIRGKMFELLPETTFVFVTGEAPENSEFGRILTIHNGRLEGNDEAAPAPQEEGEGEASNINTEAAVLANIPLFTGIDSNQLKLLAFHSQPMEFKAGENLITQGEQGEAAYVILEGKVKILLEGDDEIVLAERGKNALLGELSLLSDSVTTATVRAETKVTALQIKKEMFIQLLESDAVVASHVARLISDKLVESLQLLSKAA